MYCSTMVLSVQKVENPRSRFSSFRSNAFCLAGKVAACNSSRGTVSFLIGASLDLAITMVQFTLPSVAITHRYDTTP